MCILFLLLFWIVVIPCSEANPEGCKDQDVPVIIKEILFKAQQDAVNVKLKTNVNLDIAMIRLCYQSNRRTCNSGICQQGYCPLATAAYLLNISSDPKFIGSEEDKNLYNRIKMERPSPSSPLHITLHITKDDLPIDFQILKKTKSEPIASCLKVYSLVEGGKANQRSTPSVTGAPSTRVRTATDFGNETASDTHITRRQPPGIKYDELSTGEIVGIICGTIVVLLLFAFCIYQVYNYYAKKRFRAPEGNNSKNCTSVLLPEEHCL